jgi:carbon-monoxide dehydrogenase medium subunit
MVRQAEIAAHPVIRSRYTALWEASSAVASTQVRNLGTIGGNLCHGDPTADPPAALIALGAQLQIAGPGGTRTVPVEAFFTGYLSVDLATDEILTGVQVPAPTPSSASVYIKLRVRPVDVAIVGAAAWLQRTPDTARIKDVRIGLAGAAVTHIRATEAEGILRGEEYTEDKVREAAAAAAAQSDPLSDLEASDWYRREMVREIVGRAVRRCYELARAAMP